MKFCGRCGAEMKEGSRYCHVCGAAVKQAAPGASPRYTGVYQQAPKKRSHKKLIAVVAALAVVVLAAVLVISLFGGAGAKVTKAFIKSGKEFSAVAEQLKLTDVSGLLQEKKVSQSVAVRLEEADGLAELEGAGIRMNVNVDLSGRKIGMSMTPFLGSADLVSLQVKLDDSKIYMGSPQLTENTFYMVNTQTIGRDLAALDESLDTEELENLGFNLFDILEKVQKANEGNEQAVKEAKKAFAEFAKTIEVEKSEKKALRVNGNEMNCTGYDVVLTRTGMEDLLDALEAAYSNVDNTDAYLEIWKSLGLPEDVLDEIKRGMKNGSSSVEEIFDGLRDAVKELGDIELDVYLSNGYVVAVVYDEEIDGEDVTVTLNIGGGKQYVDDISLRLEGEDYGVSLVSTGNHACEGGKFTDRLEIIESYGDEDETLAALEVSYDLKAKSDNFQLTLSADGEELELRGYLEMGKDALVVELTELAIADEVIIGVDYRLEKYNQDTIVIGNSLELATLTEDALMAEVEKLTENAEALVGKLMEEYPSLIYYFF